MIDKKSPILGMTLPKTKAIVQMKMTIPIQVPQPTKLCECACLVLPKILWKRNLEATFEYMAPMTTVGTRTKAKADFLAQGSDRDPIEGAVEY